MTTTPLRVSDPATLEAIDAEYFRAIYDAERLARLRYAGSEPAPIPSRRALHLLRRARARELNLRVVGSGQAVSA